MGNPAYDARREAERAEAEKEKAVAEAAQAAFEAVTNFMRGKATLSIMPNYAGSAVAGSGGWNIRLIRDVK